MSGDTSAESGYYGNVVWQAPDEPLSTVISGDAVREAPTKFYHVVNLYSPPGTEGLDAVQERTIDSMRRARRYAAERGTDITLVAVHKPSDADLVPDDFTRAEPITRTICDLPGFATSRPLPLLFDILDSAGGTCTRPDGYVIFTNSDICLQPGFYASVQDMLRVADAIIINRRTIDSAALDASYEVAAAEIGEPHPGMDCFVFPGAWLGRFDATTSIIGTGFVMRSLLHNLVSLADRLLFLGGAHLTFHFGDDRPWLSDKYKAHIEHNNAEARRLVARLRESEPARSRLDWFFDQHPRFRPRLPAKTEKSIAPGFSSARYQLINEARLRHLASLGLDIDGRSVLELGAGPGDLTGFFIERGCTVTSIDARPENIAALVERHPSVEGLVINLDGPLESLERQFDIVFCYGLLYHLGYPAEVLAWSAQHCNDFALFSTCVHPGEGVHLNPVRENPETGTQSATGAACRPTRAWVLGELARHFPYSGMCRTQPRHVEFPTDWDRAAQTAELQEPLGLCRAVFIGSHAEYNDRAFSPVVVNRHDATVE